MVSREKSFLHIDGTIVCLDDLVCLYATQTKSAIVLRFADGQQTEIKYGTKSSATTAWDSIIKCLREDFETGEEFIFPHRSIILRISGLRYAEFDTIDYRFVLQYKDGSTYAFRYGSKKITYEIYKRLMKALLGWDIITRLPIATERHRADFWADKMEVIDGMAVGEDLKNAEFWQKIDKSFVDAQKASLKKS